MYTREVINKLLFFVKLYNFLISGWIVLVLFILFFPEKIQSFDFPDHLNIPVTDLLVTKTNTAAVIYIMNDWENCDPATLKRGDGSALDCWSHLKNESPLPANRQLHALGSMGSHIAFEWDKLHIGPDQYNWSALDAYLQVASTMSTKDFEGNYLPFKPVIVTFSEYLQVDANPHDGQKDMIAYIPEFVKQKIPQDQLEFKIANCDVQDMVPYHHEIFQQYYREFIEAAIDHLKKSPYSYVVQGYLLSGGVSHETTPVKSLDNCDYRGFYKSRYNEGYRNFIKESIKWTAQALQKGGSNHLTGFLQSAAAPPSDRYQYFEVAYPLNIGFKMNSVAPSNANGISARPQSIGLYDALAMTELTWPKGFEPVYPIRSPSGERCSARYCFSDARYQGVYWDLLTMLGYKADQIDMQKESFIWRLQMMIKFGLGWLPQLLDQSIGKSANQTRTAWIAFADRFNDEDSFPNPRPEPPLEVGSGDYYKAEFTERGDRDFYLYRLGEFDDSTLIRQQAGVISSEQNNYALSQNSCFRSSSDLPNQANLMLTGQYLRNSGLLSSDQFAHPFSATALSTDGENSQTQISLVLEKNASLIKNSSVVIVVEYLDAGSDQFAVDYVNSNGDLQKKVVKKSNSKQWKTARLEIPRGEISWNGDLEGGADLRLDCMCDQSRQGDDIFHMVRIEANSRPSDQSASNQLDFCSNNTCRINPDFNNDNLINLKDISLLLTQVHSSTLDLRFDLNCDQLINLQDLHLLFSKLKW